MDKPPGDWNILEKWGFYRLSHLMQVQQVRLDLLQLRARAALAVGTIPSTQAFLLTAERQVRRIEKEPAPSSMAHAYYIRAAIAAVRGNDMHALTLLDLATEVFNSIDMFSFAAAMRRRRGELLGGEEGRARNGSERLDDQPGNSEPHALYRQYAPASRIIVSQTSAVKRAVETGWTSSESAPLAFANVHVATQSASAPVLRSMRSFISTSARDLIISPRERARSAF